MNINITEQDKIHISHLIAVFNRLYTFLNLYFSGSYIIPEKKADYFYAYLTNQFEYSLNTINEELYKKVTLLSEIRSIYEPPYDSIIVDCVEVGEEWELIHEARFIKIVAKVNRLIFTAGISKDFIEDIKLNHQVSKNENIYETLEDSKKTERIIEFYNAYDVFMAEHKILKEEKDPFKVHCPIRLDNNTGDVFLKNKNIGKLGLKTHKFLYLNILIQEYPNKIEYEQIKKQLDTIDTRSASEWCTEVKRKLIKDIPEVKKFLQHNNGAVIINT